MTRCRAGSMAVVWMAAVLLPVAVAQAAEVPEIGGETVGAVVLQGINRATARPSQAHGALRIGAWGLSLPAFGVLQRAAIRRDAQARPSAVLAAVIEDHVLGDRARRTLGDARLFDDARVGFAVRVSAQAMLVATLELAYQEQLGSATARLAAEGMVLRRHVPQPERLQALLGGAKLALDDRLTKQQEAALARLVLLTLRMDGGALQQVTLGDVWQQLDVHGRNQVRQFDTDFIAHQAMALARTAFVRQWVLRQGGLSGRDLSQLHGLIADRERRVAWARVLGASGDTHYQSPELERLRRWVRPDQIVRYHARHPEQFQRIERVRASHIRCPELSCVQAVNEALATGLPFDAVARKHSHADSAAAGGALGWVDAARTGNNWLYQVALAQVPGAAPTTVREPEGGHAAPGWQLVRVEERVMGRHPANSETVRFAASQAIAGQRAADRYGAMRRRLIGAAGVTIDPVLAVSMATVREHWQP